MKTKNNVQKTILRSGAVVVSLVLISLTVSAQDFWRKLLVNSSINEIALAMSETSKKDEIPATSKSDFSAVYFLQEEIEVPLHIEEWMTDKDNFSDEAFKLEVEREGKLELENWMLNEDSFGNSQEGEPELEIENWMVSERVWNS
ncbi:MAG: hypothetical protein R2757_13250 [Draconibacterium sp.]